MNDDWSRNRGAAFEGTRWPVIILTVLFSCTSFTLGYFVGKTGSVVGVDTRNQPSDSAPSVLPLQQQESPKDMSASGQPSVPEQQESTPAQQQNPDKQPAHPFRP